MFFRIVCILGSLWVVSKVLGSIPLDLGEIPILLIALVAALVFVPKAIRNHNQSALRKSLYTKTSTAIDEQIDQLARKRTQRLLQDDYGNVRYEPWNKEIHYFVSSYLSPRLSSDERTVLVIETDQIFRLIDARAATAAKESPAFRAFSPEMSPSEFEFFCAEQLRQLGWDARVTKQSRDQGVDVIGQKAGIRIVIQCKLYSSPVGNKSVQEAAAAKAHEKAHLGAVVSNNRFTQPAKELARSNGILLLHFSELAQLEAFVVQPTL
jgi:restriction system protein